MAGNDILDEVPSFAKVLKDAIEQRVCDMHVALPGQVESFDGRKAKIQLLLTRRYKDGEEITFPPVENVPILMPQTENASVYLPIEVGTTGLVVFNERSLDQWLVAGGTVNPNDPRKFHLSDAVFIPGLRPFNKETDYDPMRLVIRYKQGKIVVGDGKVAIGKVGGDELLDLVSQLAGQLSQTQTDIQLITVPTVLGPSGPPINAASFVAIKAAVDAIQSKIDAIKDALS